MSTNSPNPTPPAMGIEKWAEAKEKLVELPGPIDQTRVVVDNCGDIFTLCFHDPDDEYRLKYEAWLNSPEQRHSLAALCLFEQPFGFTHADVAIVRKLFSAIREKGIAWIEDANAFRDLANRIAALLPPETPHV